MPLSDAVSEYCHLPNPQSMRSDAKGHDIDISHADKIQPTLSHCKMVSALPSGANWVKFTGESSLWLCPVWLADADRLVSPTHALPQKTHPVLTANHWQAGQAIICKSIRSSKGPDSFSWLAFDLLRSALAATWFIPIVATGAGFIAATSWKLAGNRTWELARLMTISLFSMGCLSTSSSTCDQTLESHQNTPPVGERDFTGFGRWAASHERHCWSSMMDLAKGRVLATPRSHNHWWHCQSR